LVSAHLTPEVQALGCPPIADRKELEPPMQDDQGHGRIFGVLFIITFITSISALVLFQSVLDDPAGYIAGGGKDNQIYLGAFLDFLLIIANVGTAVVLYRVRGGRTRPSPSATSLLESSSASSSRPGSSLCSGS
jgi:Domain of unknown function (DUF4386)